MKRLFIAVNPDEKSRKIIENIADQIRPIFDGHLGIRFLKPGTWHLTVSFLGYQPDHAVGSILNSLKLCADNFESPAIEFEKLIFMPYQSESPKMIWMKGSRKTSKKLSEIKNNVEKSLMEMKVGFKTEYKQFNSHLTLAKFNKEIEVDFQKINLPEIGNFGFIPKTLDLMESRLGKNGADYEIISRMDFKNPV